MYYYHKKIHLLPLDFDLLLKKIKSKYNTDTEVYGVESLTANSLIKEAKLFNPISGDLLLR